MAELYPAYAVGLKAFDELNAKYPGAFIEWMRMEVETTAQGTPVISLLTEFHEDPAGVLIADEGDRKWLWRPPGEHVASLAKALGVPGEWVEHQGPRD